MIWLVPPLRENLVPHKIILPHGVTKFHFNSSKMNINYSNSILTLNDLHSSSSLVLARLSVISLVTDCNRVSNTLLCSSKKSVRFV